MVMAVLLGHECWHMQGPPPFRQLYSNFKGFAPRKYALVDFLQVILIFGYNLLHHFAIVSSIFALMVEVNSVFLHGRKLLQMLGVPFSHWFYRTIALLNLLSFVLFRGVPLALTCVAFVLNVHRCTPLYAVVLGTVLAFMALLNPVLFWRLLRNDLLRGSLKKKGGKEERGGEMVNGGKAPQLWLQNGHLKDEAAVQSDGKFCSSPRNGLNVLHRSKAS